MGLGGADRDDLMTAAKAATMPSETIHNMPFSVDAEMVCDAMIAAARTVERSGSDVSALNPAADPAGREALHLLERYQVEVPWDRVLERGCCYGKVERLLV